MQKDNVHLAKPLAKPDTRLATFRDTILYQRGALAENGMTNVQVNDVLSEFDTIFAEPDLPSNGEYLAREMQFGADMVSKYSKVCQELATIKRVAACGTVTSFLALLDDEKRNWFALAIDDSERRQKAERCIEELVNTLQLVLTGLDNGSVKSKPIMNFNTDAENIEIESLASVIRAALAKAQSGVNPDSPLTTRRSKSKNSQSI